MSDVVRFLKECRILIGPLTSTLLSLAIDFKECVVSPAVSSLKRWIETRSARGSHFVFQSACEPPDSIRVDYLSGFDQVFGARVNRARTYDIIN